MGNLPRQLELCPPVPLPNVYGAADYREFRETLACIDRHLHQSGMEEAMIDLGLARWEKACEEPPTVTQRQKQYEQLRYALRCNVARHLTGDSYRELSIRLSDSTLLQWFTGIHGFGSAKAASKSSLERYDKLFEAEEVGEAIRWLLGSAADAACATERLGLAAAVRLDAVFADCTCVAANIHFPVDWVLLRDATRTLIAAIRLIRAQGLKHRIPEPSALLKRMNQLSIRMTETRRRADSKKQRKAILREMKKLMRTIERHAQRYRDLLKGEWEQTEWSEAEARQVWERIEDVLNKLPAAIKQAHERIIGERRVPNKEKLLSLYEDDVHVLVRGKAGAEVEFGNGFYLAEQADGLIIDWEFFKDQPPADSQLVKRSLDRLEASYGPIASYTADRGFDSAENAEWLEKHEVYNAICPRNPRRLMERREEPRFLQLQTRRGQTEGRVGIFKNAYLGRPLRSKSYEHRHLSVVWSVLTHNLWLLARMALADEHSRQQAA